METADFRKVLAARDDGFWELLATAVGVERSLTKTIAGLEGASFKLGTNGVAATPSVVHDRVNALAAYEPRLLVRLAAGWKKPSDLYRQGLMDEESDFVLGAWCAAIRFLVRERAISEKDLKSEIPGIERQIANCFAPPPVVPATWRELVESIDDGRLGLAQWSALDRAVLPTEAVDEHTLRDMLSHPPPTTDPARKSHWPQFGMLRILRGRENQLTQSAAEYLGETVVRLCSEDRQLLESGALCAAAEVGVRICLGLRAKLMALVAEALSGSGRPRELALLSYVLLDTGWTLP